MAMKESVYHRLAKEINSDNIRNVLPEIKEQVTDGTIALKLLVHTNQLVYKAVTQKTFCKSSVSDIVELCELCCSTIVSKWSSSVEKTRVYGCLYHIVSYLIFKGNTEYINKICSYIFSIHEHSNEVEGEKEKKILQNFISRLVMYIGNSLEKYCQCLVSESEQSLSTFCKLIFKLDSLCDYSNNSTYLTFLHRISHFCQTNCRTDLLTFQLECLQLLTPKTVTDFDKLIRFLYAALSELVELNSPQKECNFLLEYTQSFENYVDDKSKKIFSLFYNISLFLTSKSEEMTFIQVVFQCNIILKYWCLNNNNSAVVTSCRCAFILIFNMRSNWLIHISNFQPYGLEQILDFFTNFYEVLKGQTSESCILPSGEKCSLKVDTVNLVNCQYLILELISTCGKISNDILKECYTRALEAQQDCLHWLEQMKQVNCPKLQFACNWIFTVFVKISRLIDVVFEDEMEFITTAFKFMFTLPSEIIHTPDFTIKALALTVCLGNIYHKNGKLDKTLTVLSATLSVWFESGVQLFSLWSDFKHNQIVLECEEYLELTIYDIIKKNKEEIEKNWTVCNLSDAQIVNFLMMEMEVYYKNSLLRGKPLLAAFNALRKLTRDSIFIAKALVMAMEVSSSSDKYSSDLEKHLELSKKILLLLKKQVLKKDCKELEFVIGDILYHQFRCGVRSARSKSSQEISFSTKPLENRKQIEDTNPNDKCEVNPVYSSLSIKKQADLLKKIDEAVKQWEIAGCKVTEKPETITVTLENIWNAGLMYKLYCLKDKEVATWRLMYDIATKFDVVDMKILAISELLEHNEDLPSVWIVECMEAIDKLQIKQKIKSAFQINWFKQCLIQQKNSEGLPVFQNFNSQWKSNTYTHIMTLLKLNNLQSILSGFNLEGYLPSNPVGLQTALSMCLRYATVDSQPRNFSQLSQIHDFGLQASHDLGVIYWNMKLPRQARCYLKSHINIAQKLALPLRTAQLLCLLTWLDVDCGNTTDAYNKLEGLEAILDIEHYEGLATQNYSTSSPTFKKSCIKLPDFFNHKRNCKCFCCNNVEYQRLVLETATLRAEYSNLTGDKTNAFNFFKVGFKILEVFEQKKITSEALTISQVRLWLRYAALQGLLQNYSEAIEANQKAEQLVDANDFFTHSDIVYQRCNLQLIQYNMPKEVPVSVKNKQSTSKIKMSRIPRKLEPKDFKTPLLFPKHVVAEKSPLSVKNNFITPVRPIRPLLFDSSDDDDHEKCKENKTVTRKKIQKKTKATTKNLFCNSNVVLHSPMAVMSSLKEERKVFSVFSDDSETL